MKSTRILPASIVAAGVGLPLAAPFAHAADPKEVSKDIIAVQIRKQGFECKNPESATRDPAASKPDDAAWILTCEGVTYKVVLVPNMAAKVERLADDQKSTEQP
jgi:ribosomal protein S12